MSIAELFKTDSDAQLNKDAQAALEKKEEVSPDQSSKDSTKVSTVVIQPQVKIASGKEELVKVAQAGLSKLAAHFSELYDRVKKYEKLAAEYEKHNKIATIVDKLVESGHITEEEKFSKIAELQSCPVSEFPNPDEISKLSRFVSPIGNFESSKTAGFDAVAKFNTFLLG